MKFIHLKFTIWTRFVYNLFTTNVKSTGKLGERTDENADKCVKTGMTGQA